MTLFLLMAGGIAVPSGTDSPPRDIRNPANDLNPSESGPTGPGGWVLDAGFRKVQTY
jgi:hypothetical protein